MYAGAGSGPLMAAATAHANLSAEISTTASQWESIISMLTTEQWTGGGSGAAAAAAQPIVSYLTETAATLEQASVQATASAAAYEAAFAATVPPPVIAANRSLLATLVATNFLGVNSAAIARPVLLDEIADRFGAQALVLSLDVKRSPRTASGFVVTTHGGRTETDLDALAWAREAIERGAGELLVNSIDADGTKQGFDLELIGLMRELSSVPVIASGGAGATEHFAPAVQAGADAVLAASVFHSGQLTIDDVKRALRAEGIVTR